MSDDDAWRTMAASVNSSPMHREQDLLGQTVLVIGGSSGIGLETARLARAQGADIILTARIPDRPLLRAAGRVRPRRGTPRRRRPSPAAAAGR